VISIPIVKTLWKRPPWLVPATHAAILIVAATAQAMTAQEATAQVATAQVATAQVATAEAAVQLDAETQQVIDQALAWLAARQTPSGAWMGGRDDERRYPVGMTSYALMAFLAAGCVPGEGPHGQTVTRGVGYLLSQVGDDGLLGNRDSGHYMYEHGIATVVLAEVYGQSLDTRLRDRLERMVKVIISSQNAEGGWRYRPVMRDADLSVTVLQVTALRAARNNGLAVPERTIDEAVNYVRSCFVPAEGGFAYQPGDEAGFARTAAAIYSLQVCGQYDDPLVQQGSEYLFRRFDPGSEWFAYGSFYAAPAQYMIGGETWQRWYATVKRVLLREVQRSAGQAYWDRRLDPGSPGPIYSTAVFTTVLAMPNHFIPLYQR
jgi:prenyltransferase beta subunit